MTIVSIFADRLFAFHYDDEVRNEYDRLLNLWNDTLYLRKFLQENAADLPANKTLSQVVLDIVDDSYLIDDTLISISEEPNRPLDEFFRPLHNREYQTRVLSLRKGRERYLRLYAIRIDADCFVITGGAIKLTRLMEERTHTQRELGKLESAKGFLQKQDVFDEDSFFEYIAEQQND